MNPDVFEIIMLICFGAAWPFSICKMLKTKKSNGKSLGFLAVILTGYLAGILFEFFGERNAVIFLYLLNTGLVTVDLALTIKYSHPGVASVDLN